MAERFTAKRKNRTMKNVCLQMCGNFVWRQQLLSFLSLGILPKVLDQNTNMAVEHLDVSLGDAEVTLWICAQ